MKENRLSLLAAGMVIVAGLFVVGCASAPNLSQKSATELLEQADSYFANNNLQKALPLYIEVANREDIPTDQKAYAQFRTGRIYDRNGDVEKSVEWYTKAATLGNSVAQLNLGNYYHGKKDYVRAFELYMKSAEQGEPQAEYNVFVYYLQGLGGVNEDNKIAVEWLEKAYIHGSEDAEQVMRQFGLLK